MDDSYNLVDSVESNSGLNSVSNNEFESVLIQHIQHWLSDHHPMIIVMSGMVGARQGWVEAPYRETPCRISGSQELLTVPTIDPRLRVFVVPGVCQLDPADVMRGEETQVFGYLAKNENFSGLICLPGTHSKWVDVRDLTIQRFRTWMTGELFDVLSNQSVLRYSTATEDWDHSAFMHAAQKALSLKEGILEALFSIRARDLLQDVSAAESKATLSGLVLGAECAQALHWYQSNEQQPIPLIGAEKLTSLYASVLSLAGRTCEIVDIASVNLSGLKSVANSVLSENSNA